MDKYFLVQVKRTNGTLEKGVVIKDTYESAKQGYHSYLGAYAFGNHAQTDYVMVHILNGQGLGMLGEVWEKQVEPEPEEEAF